MVREVLQTMGSDDVRFFADKIESFSSRENGNHLRTGQGDRGSVIAIQDDDRAPVDEAKPKPVKRLQHPESSSHASSKTSGKNALLIQPS